MDLKNLIRDEDAVSPVIGVILMVAITVILAAVIASFVLGLGDQTQQTPQASFSFEFDSSSGLTITHDGGDAIQANELHIRGTDGASSVDNTWGNFGSPSGSSKVTAGDSATLGSATSSYDIRVVFEAQEGDASATIAHDKGPDA